ncbi:hypothetical protein MF672_039630 [Actinomadura sp. ATCC 31491]|uniref:Septum formation initiator n=1 Tax=Actinomadura luzonensis TaxID=2805427 RepID=A0ABT0G5H8_9ACTN|nr:hypothetical protein [Actinomadura luzonensis]MCK2219867.1 hypothetical protein [Actinomadura luzonensis]
MKKYLLAWAATAVAATGASLAVLGLLGTGVTGTPGRVLSEEEVAAALATATARAAATPAGTPGQGQEGRLIRGAGGTVIASCDAAGLVTLRSWSPAQDWSVDGVEPGPAPEAKVEFEPPEGEDVELTIACSAGRPVLRQG